VTGPVDDGPGEVAEGYVPAVSAHEAERIRAWHERAYAAATAQVSSGLVMECLGRTFVVPPQVFPPSGTLLAEAVLDEVRPDDRVLDMGTGSGIDAIVAASISSDVTAVDINPRAVEAARYNAILNGVQDRVRVYESDVFDRVEGRFDLIVFDPPFRWFAPRDLLEVAMTDEGYTTLIRFFARVHEHLTKGGRILIHFGTSGDLAFLESLIDRHGFARETVGTTRVITSEWEVDYFAFRLTTT
jgi:release factor glutamine methyltransferase